MARIQQDTTEEANMQTTRRGFLKLLGAGTVTTAAGFTMAPAKLLEVIPPAAAPVETITKIVLPTQYKTMIGSAAMDVLKAQYFFSDHLPRDEFGSHTIMALRQHVQQVEEPKRINEDEVLDQIFPQEITGDMYLQTFKMADVDAETIANGLYQFEQGILMKFAEYDARADNTV